ncbi:MULTISPECIES: hypothetical protein [Sphingobacterium]|jgi:hypothetical protein|uniref:hypothetical protein n=1 Tax=Sphingobacterium TaxID=28453 RepID=UPI0004E5F192|nr:MULTISPECIES: hypothetical protein [Sphingobacterium]UZJ64525.1 hypothetical protein OKW96_19510 [Sphingobacterium sp. KU25419]CDS92517.1 conserved hypothetical protein [Sphingobacterium sp. PM2-P1-29]SJN43680.1 hypothetical protein FM120_14915 [Sphingobacterium faecium PCAi_F2.5]MQP29017.1 hypothetical protein [Sphingobacterium faecium]PTX10049.1 hypothetical protein C8N37_10556 [Sphingobacterium faecium]
MDNRNKYDSATVALEKLKEAGYVIDYNIELEPLIANPSNYKIDYVYRYEGDSNPDDENTVYGIAEKNSLNKGVFVIGNLSFVEGKIRDVIINLEIAHKQEI